VSVQVTASADVALIETHSIDVVALGGTYESTYNLFAG